MIKKNEMIFFCFFVVSSRELLLGRDACFSLSKLLDSSLPGITVICNNIPTMIPQIDGLCALNMLLQCMQLGIKTVNSPALSKGNKICLLALQKPTNQHIMSCSFNPWGKKQ